MQLSALGIAIAPMVTVAEILKNRGLAVEKRISTALESLSDDYRQAPMPAAARSLRDPVHRRVRLHAQHAVIMWACRALLTTLWSPPRRTRQKPNMEIVLMKSPDFDDIIAQENLPGRSTGADAEDLVSELDGARTHSYGSNICSCAAPCMRSHAPHARAGCWDITPVAGTRQGVPGV